MDVAKLLSAPVTGLIDAVGGVIDNLHTSDEERVQAREKLEEIAILHRERVLGHAETIAALQRDVVTAELGQDDAYTKRARPAPVYAGLIVLVLNHILLPWAAYFTGQAVPSIELPTEFWWGWTGVVGAWAVGRSVEKKARIEGERPGRLTRVITGGG